MITFIIIAVPILIILGCIAFFVPKILEQVNTSGFSNPHTNNWEWLFGKDTMVTPERSRVLFFLFVAIATILFGVVIMSPVKFLIFDKFLDVLESPGSLLSQIGWAFSWATTLICVVLFSKFLTENELYLEAPAGSVIVPKIFGRRWKSFLFTEGSHRVPYFVKGIIIPITDQSLDIEINNVTSADGAELKGRVSIVHYNHDPHTVAGIMESTKNGKDVGIDILLKDSNATTVRKAICNMKYDDITKNTRVGVDDVNETLWEELKKEPGVTEEIINPGEKRLVFTRWGSTFRSLLVKEMIGADPKVRRSREEKIIFEAKREGDLAENQTLLNIVTRLMAPKKIDPQTGENTGGLGISRKEALELAQRNLGLFPKEFFLRAGEGAGADFNRLILAMMANASK